MEIDKELMAGTTTLMVLSVLRKQENYGYGIIRELASRSNNTFHLKEGTLYPLLHGMENKGYLTSYLRETENGRRRKYYRITPKGLALLESKTRQWSFFAQKVNEVVFNEMTALT